MVGLHIWSATKLSLENKAARPVGYAVYQPVGSSYASRTMLMSGIIVFVFIVYHLLHYTAEVQYLNLTGQDFAAFMEKLPAGAGGAARHLQDDGGRLQQPLGFRLLHPGHGAALPAPEPRRQQHVPIAGLEERGLPARSSTGRRRWSRWLIFLGYISIPVAILWATERRR